MRGRNSPPAGHWIPVTFVEEKEPSAGIDWGGEALSSSPDIEDGGCWGHKCVDDGKHISENASGMLGGMAKRMIHALIAGEP